MDQITDREKTRPRRKERELTGVDEFLYPIRDYLGLVTEDRRRARETARARHRRIRSKMRRGIAPTNSLARRIVAFNLIGLGLLVAGVLYLNQFRSGLIDQSTQNLQTQGEIIAAAVAEAAGTGPGGTRFDPVRANAVLRRLVQPSGVRAQIYDRAGRLTGDTRNLLRGAGKVKTLPLAPPGETEEVAVISTVEKIYHDVLEFFTGAPAIYQETPSTGIAEEKEVYTALRGGVAKWERVNSEGELIVSVTVPIQRFKAVLGVLMLSTEGGDIDAIVRAERMAILQVFLVALATSLTLSVLLANTIAKPIRRLAEAAEEGGAREARPLNPQRINFPDLTARTDEIGYLSQALRRMTDALYDRIDAIETFAADVAHEIKNPLTSLRSAVETLRIARTPDMQARLLQVIEKDVSRLDRLVTDISNASRLDAELVREEMSSFDLGALIHTMADLNLTEAEARGARVEVAPIQGPLMVPGLEGRIGQVLQNLIGNALSFSPKGGVVTVTAAARGSTVRVEVSDQGPGMPEDSLGSVFERFYSDRPDHEEFGNHSGLGLSISRQIVEAHGGLIWAENIRDEANPGGPPLGARFIVELPL